MQNVTLEIFQNSNYVICDQECMSDRCCGNRDRNICQNIRSTDNVWHSLDIKHIHNMHIWDHTAAQLTSVMWKPSKFYSEQETNSQYIFKKCGYYDPFCSSHVTQNVQDIRTVPALLRLSLNQPDVSHVPRLIQNWSETECNCTVHQIFTKFLCYHPWPCGISSGILCLGIMTQYRHATHHTQTQSIVNTRVRTIAKIQYSNSWYYRWKQSADMTPTVIVLGLTWAKPRPF